ncbi:LysR family transcriptional regulator [Colwellia sp. UCD-KL20]|uniref:LysR family transcriptional regulator n=1 Tax=Colwellia sp. UCD-KL20 TaxID=1917165 RepID=UPI000970A6EB|nr:LysR family transcriptional regulator [Colwellia sp. UCD-KL20]
MNVTLKQIRAFVTVAKSSSFAEACEILHLSQPALSISIKNLESTVGGPLFIRSTRSVSLTPEGEDFFPVAKNLLINWDDAFSDLGNLFSLNRGKLTVAAMPSFASSELPAQLQIFKENFPKINIKVHDVIAEDAVNMVRNGQVELALTFDPDEADYLNFEPLFTDNFIIALPQEHPLLKHDVITWQMVSQYPFITLQRPSSIRQLLETSLSDENIDLNIEFEANQLATIGQMVSINLGISAMPSLCKTHLRAQGVICRPLTSPPISRRVGIVTRSRYPLSSAAKAFIDIIKNEYHSRTI